MCTIDAIHKAYHLNEKHIKGRQTPKIFRFKRVDSECEFWEDTKLICYGFWTKTSNIN